MVTKVLPHHGHHGDAMKNSISLDSPSTQRRHESAANRKAIPSDGFSA
jgi:hypothetical protein